MASQDDINSTLKGWVQNLGTITQWLTSPGQTLSSTTSPKATVYTTLSTSSVQVIGTSLVRRAIWFMNSNPAGNNIWVVPANLTAASNQGILLVPGDDRAIPPTLAVNAAFNAIAATGSANILTIVEFF